MFERILGCNNLEQSIFLFGARQTGKSTLLKNKFKDAIFFDLLDSDLGNRLRRRPALLYETLKNKAANTLVIIDEIPEIPQLLNEVHRLISEKQLIFILCGSSARKLKRKGQNNLGGRAVRIHRRLPERRDFARSVGTQPVPFRTFSGSSGTDQRRDGQLQQRRYRLRHQRKHGQRIFLHPAGYVNRLYGTRLCQNRQASLDTSAALLLL